MTKVKSRYSEAKGGMNYTLQRKPSEYALEIPLRVFLQLKGYQRNQDALNAGPWL